jgi:hypothetical protein
MPSSPQSMVVCDSDSIILVHIRYIATRDALTHASLMYKTDQQIILPSSFVSRPLIRYNFAVHLITGKVSLVAAQRIPARKI